MKEIYATPINERKEFTFDGDTLRQREHNETTGLWLYERYNNKGRLVGYELVKGKNRKQPNGEVVQIYPSSEDFGRYGWAFPPRTNRQSLVEALAIADKDERNKHIKFDF